MRLYELQSSSIDRQLKQTANNIKRAGPGGPQPEQPDQGQEMPGSGPMTNPDDPLGQFQDQPDDPMMSGPSGDEQEEERVKKVDSYVIAAVRGQPYLKKNWNHRDGSPTHPMSIMGMTLDELYNSRNTVRYELQKTTTSDKVGLYANEYVEYLNDMLAFIDSVIDAKKQGTEKNPKKGETRKAKFRTQDPSKNAKSREVKVKRQK